MGKSSGVVRSRRRLNRRASVNLQMMDQEHFFNSSWRNVMEVPEGKSADHRWDTSSPNQEHLQPDVWRPVQCPLQRFNLEQ